MKPIFEIESGVPYIDNAVTTPISTSVLEAMLPYLQENYGDPDEPYAVGRAAADGLARARNDIAELLESDPEFLWFTSSGTEANNWAVTKVKRPGIPVCSAVEHLSVLRPVEALGGKVIPVHESGLIDLDVLDATLAAEEVSIVSVQHANQDTGIIQPIDEVANICSSRGVPLHVDACMSFGVVETLLFDLGVDFLTLSSHKVWGPVGSGALVSSGRVEVAPFMLGGQQESGMRGGPVNMAAVAGFAKAAQEMWSRKKNWEKVGTLRDKMEIDIVESQSVTIVGGTSQRLPNASCIVIEGADATFIAVELERLYGMCVGLGGAAESGTSSRVLEAMNIEAQQRESAIRLLFGPFVTKNEMDLVSVGLACAAKAGKDKALV